MGKVFVDIGMTLDGFIAGPNGGVKHPLGEGGIAIHQWMFKQKAFLSLLRLPGGEEGTRDGEIISNTFNRIGANIMGKKMFIEGEANWPEQAPFGCPVYVMTREKRAPWERPGGTTFYFEQGKIEDVLQKAKQAAGTKDVRISGGADVIQQYFNAGFVDELDIHLAPIILGKGVRLFDNFKKEKFPLEIKDVVSSPAVTHLRYQVKK